MPLAVVTLRDLERYMGLVGAEVRMPLGEPWRVGRRPYGKDVLCQSLSDRQRHVLETLLHVPEGKRVSDLERWRKGPVKSTGRAMVEALERVSEINSVGIARVDLDSVPHRRLVELARYGMAGKATLLRRHGTARKIATLVATVRYLEAKSVDGALELLDLLVTTELLGKAETETNKERVRRHPKLARASATLAAAVDIGGGANYEKITALLKRYRALKR